MMADITMTDADLAQALIADIDRMNHEQGETTDAGKSAGKRMSPDEMELDDAISKPKKPKLPLLEIPGKKSSPPPKKKRSPTPPRTSSKGKEKALDAAAEPPADPESDETESLGSLAKYAELYPDLDDIERAQKRFEAKYLSIKPIDKEHLGVFGHVDVIIEKTAENMRYKADSGISRPWLLIKKQTKFTTKYDDKKDQNVYSWDHGDLLGEVQAMTNLGDLATKYYADLSGNAHLYPVKYFMIHYDSHVIVDPETLQHRIVWFTAPHIRGPSIGNVFDAILEGEQEDRGLFPRHLIAPLVVQLMEAVLFMHMPTLDKPFIQWHADLHQFNIMLDLDEKVPYESQAGVNGVPCVKIIDFGLADAKIVDVADILKNKDFTYKDWLEWTVPTGRPNLFDPMTPYSRMVKDLDSIRNTLVRMLFSKSFTGVYPILTGLETETIGADSQIVKDVGLNFDHWEPVDRALREYRLDSALTFARLWLTKENLKVSPEVIKATTKLCEKVMAKQVTDDEIEERVAEWRADEVSAEEKEHRDTLKVIEEEVKDSKEKEKRIAEEKDRHAMRCFELTDM